MKFSGACAESSQGSDSSAEYSLVVPVVTVLNSRCAHERSRSTRARRAAWIDRPSSASDGLGGARELPGARGRLNRAWKVRRLRRGGSRFGCAWLPMRSRRQVFLPLVAPQRASIARASTAVTVLTARPQPRLFPLNRHPPETRRRFPRHASAAAWAATSSQPDPQPR